MVENQIQAHDYMSSLSLSLSLAQPVEIANEPRRRPQREIYTISYYHHQTHLGEDQRVVIEKVDDSMSLMRQQLADGNSDMWILTMQGDLKPMSNN